MDNEGSVARLREIRKTLSALFDESGQCHDKMTDRWFELFDSLPIETQLPVSRYALCDQLLCRLVAIDERFLDWASEHYDIFKDK